MCLWSWWDQVFQMLEDISFFCVFRTSYVLAHKHFRKASTCGDFSEKKKRTTPSYCPHSGTSLFVWWHLRWSSVWTSALAHCFHGLSCLCCPEVILILGHHLPPTSFLVLSSPHQVCQPVGKRYFYLTWSDGTHLKRHLHNMESYNSCGWKRLFKDYLITISLPWSGVSFTVPDCSKSLYNLTLNFSNERSSTASHGNVMILWSLPT